MDHLKRIEITLPIKAAPEDIFRALTQADELRQWFSEEAEVSLPRQRYAFWGRFTPEAPDRAAGHHELLAVEPDRRLKFKWQLRGVETTVEIKLEPQEGETDLTVIHEDVPPYQEGQYAFTDFWSLSLENLRSWVERKQIGARCDFSTVPHGEVQVSVDINAPKEAIFQALIKPEELKRYIAPEPRVEPRVGGVYDYGGDFGGGPVKILELAPNEKLVFDWAQTSQAEPDTIVTWTLEGSGGRTHLTLVHSGFAPDRACEDYQVGWSHFLNRLKFMVELGAGWQKPELSAHDY